MKKLKIALAAAGLALASTGVNAAIVSISGATVDFSYDDTGLSALIGNIWATGNTLNFDPINFSAVSNDGGLSFKSATTPVINITAKMGYTLTGLSSFEQGDYFVIGDGSVKVAGNSYFNGTPQAITPSAALDVKFDDLNSLEITNWSASNSTTLNSAESATVKIQNLLFAQANVGSYAFVEKTQMSLSAATTAVVPVPGAFWLFGSVLTGVLVSRRRNITA
ncbi:hypothetical protein A1359_14590 [Methylomonas lenta]|uniref:PEP-CTERM sorting domain-containing protein n=1 Tax=Methylomonas lenta TaxID=980561 RepID=A0A177N0I8_9GAMM|nr:hypothetical protein [Methylomonas lenta]OAI11371.1 hypothetical protein A1359_14590 [Methylomonas lenta]